MMVLLDTNVVLDLMLERDPWRVEAVAIGRPTRGGSSGATFAPRQSRTSFTSAAGWSGPEKARNIVRTCLDRLKVVSVTRDLLHAAERRHGSDFEDDLQIECAAHASLEAIVTRNPSDFVASPVPVLSPGELLAYSRERTRPDASTLLDARPIS